MSYSGLIFPFPVSVNGGNGGLGGGGPSVFGGAGGSGAAGVAYLVQVAAGPV